MRKKKSGQIFSLSSPRLSSAQRLELKSILLRPGYLLPPILHLTVNRSAARISRRTGRGGPWLTPRNAPTLPVAALRTATRNIAAPTAKGLPTKRKSSAHAVTPTARDTCKLHGIRSIGAGGEQPGNTSPPRGVSFLSEPRKAPNHGNGRQKCRPFSLGLSSPSCICVSQKSARGWHSGDLRISTPDGRAAR